jgi:hypothetical protein
MATVAVSPKKKTSPVVWVALVAAAGAAYILTAPSDAPAPSSSTKRTKKASTKDDGLYTEADKLAKFASVTTPVADVFNPLVKKPVVAKIPPPNPGDGTPVGIDPRLTGGETNWYYTGLVELDGQREALLENTKTGETMYVSAGEGWKAARVRTVDVSAVVMVGPDGTAVRIPITQYGVAPGTNPVAAVAASGAPSTQPLNVPSGLTGQIGGGAIRPIPGMATMTLPDGRTVQVPYDPNNPNGNQGGGRRRGGRRNQNQGNFYGP